eukprot:1352046-Amorphochlora_amoeboformis.AAC.1
MAQTAITAATDPNMHHIGQPIDMLKAKERSAYKWKLGPFSGEKMTKGYPYGCSVRMDPIPPQDPVNVSNRGLRIGRFRESQPTEKVMSLWSRGKAVESSQLVLVERRVLYSSKSL